MVSLTRSLRSLVRDTTKFVSSRGHVISSTRRLNILFCVIIVAPNTKNCNEALSTLRRRNLNWSFISTVRSIVHTNPSRKQSFSKMLFKPEESETPVFRFRVDDNDERRNAFRKR